MVTAPELAGLDGVYEQGTNLHHALMLAGRHLRRHPNAQPVVLVVTGPCVSGPALLLNAAIVLVPHGNVAPGKLAQTVAARGMASRLARPGVMSLSCRMTGMPRRRAATR